MSDPIKTFESVEPDATTRLEQRAPSNPSQFCLPVTEFARLHYGEGANGNQDANGKLSVTSGYRL